MEAKYTKVFVVSATEIAAKEYEIAKRKVGRIHQDAWVKVHGENPSTLTGRNTMESMFGITTDENLDKEYEIAKRKVGRIYQDAWVAFHGGKQNWKKNHGGK